MNPDPFLIELIILLAAVVDSGLLLGIKKDLNAIKPSAAYSNQHSHEELHSKNENNTLGHDPKYVAANNSKQGGDPTAINPGNNLVNHRLVSEIDMIKNTNIKSSSLPSPHQTSIVSEGGVEIMSSTKDSSRIYSNETNNTTITSHKITHAPLNITETINSRRQQPAISTLDKPVHKRIHGRPGVSELDIPLVSSVLNNASYTSELPPIPRRKKPLFTMIKDDKESKESESFIESPTTGRDYVLPIVLSILSLPVVVYLIKVIYRRGTEFTERQQYHRMYLIDGMYNSR